MGVGHDASKLKDIQDLLFLASPRALGDPRPNGPLAGVLKAFFSLGSTKQTSKRRHPPFHSDCLLLSRRRNGQSFLSQAVLICEIFLYCFPVKFEKMTGFVIKSTT